jgi:hypothetical protein
MSIFTVSSYGLATQPRSYERYQPMAGSCGLSGLASHAEPSMDSVCGLTKAALEAELEAQGVPEPHLCIPADLTLEAFYWDAIREAVFKEVADDDPPPRHDYETQTVYKARLAKAAEARRGRW